MKIADLVKLLSSNGDFRGLYKMGEKDPHLSVAESREISGITHDSRKITSGSIFVCLRGARSDGHEFTAEAKTRGACAILCERVTETDLLHILVSDTRSILGEAASEIYGKPAGSMKMVAVTGTNGKSTTAFMLRSIFAREGIKQGLMGTIVYDDGSGLEKDADRTTPEATDIQCMLAEMVKNGCKSCVMETSSHGLFQRRLAGCSFDAGVFTNLTPEHLDFHGSMDHYFEAKLRLFREYMRNGCWVGAANSDDPYGRIVKSLFPERVSSFGLEASGDPDVAGRIITMNLSGIRLEVVCRKTKAVFEASLPVTGAFNAQNALGAAAVSMEMGLDPESVRKGLEGMPQVPGRLQSLCFNNGVTAIIDYAHTPDALQNVLATVREVCTGRIWSVFGSGGDRFQGNRPIMGEIASRMADHIVVTMDNPRSEDPRKIAEQIVSGIQASDGNSGKAEWRIILDRKDAVHFALDSASGGDAVVISGKGPERNIVFSDRITPYSDLDAVAEWSRKRRVQ
ncbi:MAG: UDP-N-acetylmuramoyl-L-alanyl-D-glutamate--2,6-diaminopimelate ligase [Thermovirgaceae bacterium]|nr:UDP-N-acetylmuramoyl-L-alanyl-D-glutamate--2,6-diaminopimelate ligase [Thermovirgaceae bacterium]